MADRLQKIQGILNGTCNYILTSMEAKGATFADVLAQAQKLGFAEADPAATWNGDDARAKLVILTQAGLRLQVRSEQILALPISTIEAIDFIYARELNCTIRQISLAKKEPANGGVKLYAFVRPALVPLTSLIAHVQSEPQHCHGHRRVCRPDRSLGLWRRRRSDRGSRCIRSLCHRATRGISNRPQPRKPPTSRNSAKRERGIDGAALFALRCA